MDRKIKVYDRLGKDITQQYIESEYINDQIALYCFQFNTTKVEVIKELGISVQTYYNWLKNDNKRKELRERVDRFITSKYYKMEDLI